MKKFAGRCVAAMVLAAAARGAVAAGPAPLADHVPGDAVAFFSWAGAEKLQAAYGGSNLKGFVGASGLQAFFSTTLPQIIGEKMGSPESVAMTEAQVRARLLPYWDHATAFYVGPLDFSKDPQHPTPRLALICEAGKDAGGLAAALQNYVRGASSEQIKITVARNETLVVLAVGEDANGYLNANAHSLTASPAYGHAVAAQGAFTPATPALTGYVDLHGILANIEEGLTKDPTVPAEGRAKFNAVVDAMNVRPIGQIAFTCGFDGKEWGESAFVGVPASAPRTGVLRLLDPRPLEGAAVSMIPQGAVMASVGSFDINGLVGDIAAALPKIDPAAARQWDQGMQMFRRVSGVDLRHDLLAPLDGGMMVYQTGSSLVAALKLKDPATFSASLATLLEKAPAEVRAAVESEQTPRGQVYHLHLGMYAAAMTVHKDALYISSEAGVAQAIDFVDGPHQPSLADDADFAARRKQLPERVSALSYAKPATQYAQLYQAYKALRPLAMSMAKIDLPADLLPDPTAAEPFLTPSFAGSWSDAEGVHGASRTAFPGVQYLSAQGVASVSFLTAIMLPSLSRARELSNRSADAANERGLAQGCVIWAAEHQDKLPDDLSQLVSAGEVSPRSLVSKRAGTEPLANDVVEKDKDNAAQLAKDVAEHTDFVYIGKGLGNDTNSELVILYEKPGPKITDGMSVAFEDAHAEFIRWNALAEAFKATNEYRKAHNLPVVDVDSLIPADKRPAGNP